MNAVAEIVITGTPGLIFGIVGIVVAVVWVFFIQKNQK
jgi:hypothetical protein